MSKLSTALASGEFVITCELSPPKGTDLQPLLDKAQVLRERVTAFNVTDSHGSRMSMSPIAVAVRMIERGLEPIVQVTTRDRNRLALQADLLGASALGVENIVVMGGDPPANGDHPEAKPVFDMFASQLIAVANGLQAGADMSGSALSGSPTYCIGAVVNPGASNLNDELRRMDEKLEAGARFLQTQAVYDVAAFARFVELTRDREVSILAGVIPLKSIKMANYLNAKVPGVEVPDALLRELSDADDFVTTSVQSSARVLRELRGMCQGAHVMAIGWESKVPKILESAGI